MTVSRVFAGVDQPLSAKILGVMVGLLGFMSLAFLLIFVGIYEQRLIGDHARASRQINSLLATTLENAMLGRDLAGLRDIVRRLGRQPGIDGVFILDRQFEIRFAHDAGMLGQAFSLGHAFTTDSGGKAPDASERDQASRVQAFLIEHGLGSGGPVLRSVNPMANKPACEGCHGAVTDNPVNGYLVIDYEADGIAAGARQTALTLALFGGIVVMLTGAALWWALRRLVISPLTRMGETSLAIASGDFAARTGVSGNDEIGWLGASMDTMATEIETRRDTLQRQRAFIQAVIDAVPDGVRVIGPDYRIQMVNKAYAEQQESPAEAIVGMPCYRSSHGLDEPCVASLVTCPMDEFRRGGQLSLKCRHRHVSARQRERFVEIYAGRLGIGPDGEAGEYFVESIRDLAEQVTYSMKDRLSEIGYLATGVAHEIHNPLASISLAIRAISQDLIESDRKDKVLPYLEIVQDEVERCVEITRRLMSMTQASTDQRVLLDMAVIVNEVLSLLAYQAQSTGIICHVDAAESARVHASSADIHMVILNLVQNAFHAMPDGGDLTVTIRRCADQIHLTVADTGSGIAPENIAKVFWPFWSKRADGSSGTGLGLALCRSIIENYGGSIGVTSVPGRGSVFRVDLPAADQARPND